MDNQNQTLNIIYAACLPFSNYNTWDEYLLHEPYTTIEFYATSLNKYKRGLEKYIYIRIILFYMCRKYGVAMTIRMSLYLYNDECVIADNQFIDNVNDQLLKIHNINNTLHIQFLPYTLYLETNYKNQITIKEIERIKQLLLSRKYKNTNIEFTLLYHKNINRCDICMNESCNILSFNCNHELCEECCDNIIKYNTSNYLKCHICRGSITNIKGKI